MDCSKVDLSAVVAAITILVISLPPLTGTYFLPDKTSSLSESLNDPTSHDIFVAFLVSSIPLLLANIFDFLDGFKSYRERITWYCHLVIAITSMLVGIQLDMIQSVPCMFHITSSSDVSYVHAFSCLKVVTTSALMVILHTLNPTQFTHKSTASISMMVSVVVTLRMYCSELNRHWAIAVSIIQIIIMIIIILILLRWYYPLIRNRYKLTIIDYKCLLYLVSFTIAIVGSFIVFFKHLTLKELSFSPYDSLPSDLIASYSLYMIFLIFLILIPSRISKFEAIHNMKGIIEAKKAYVQFISHELRTPLNTVFLGLKLSVDQIAEDTEDESELERRNTLLEMSSACNAALDILNELLLYDKLESGILVLNRLVVNVSDLVYESMKMFSVQVKEKNVELFLTNNSSTTLMDMYLNARPQRSSSRSISILRVSTSSQQLGPSSPRNDTNTVTCTGIYEHDEIDVDKNKIQQVIRNVISNAIKFTPESGKIQVNMKFQPDYVPKSTISHQITTMTSRFKSSRVRPSNRVEDSFRAPDNSINMYGEVTSANLMLSNSNKMSESSMRHAMESKHMIQTNSTSLATLHPSSLISTPTTTTTTTTTTNTQPPTSILTTTTHLNSGIIIGNTPPSTNLVLKSATPALPSIDEHRAIHDISSKKTSQPSAEPGAVSSRKSDSQHHSDVQLSNISSDTHSKVSDHIRHNTSTNTNNNNTIQINSNNPSFALSSNKIIKGKLVIEIYDTGAGISEENQQKLFNEIVQFNPELLQNGGGSGLGMWITRGIVDLHQGSINVYSPGEGKGSRFTLTLPMTRHVTLAQTNALLPDNILINSESAIAQSTDPSKGLTDVSEDILNALRSHITEEGEEDDIDGSSMEGSVVPMNITTTAEGTCTSALSTTRDQIYTGRKGSMYQSSEIASYLDTDYTHHSNNAYTCSKDRPSSSSSLSSNMLAHRDMKVRISHDGGFNLDRDRLETQDSYSAHSSSTIDNNNIYTNIETSRSGISSSNTDHMASNRSSSSKMNTYHITPTHHSSNTGSAKTRPSSSLFQPLSTHLSSENPPPSNSDKTLHHLHSQTDDLHLDTTTTSTIPNLHLSSNTNLHPTTSSQSLQPSHKVPTNNNNTLHTHNNTLHTTNNNTEEIQVRRSSTQIPTTDSHASLISQDASTSSVNTHDKFHISTSPRHQHSHSPTHKKSTSSPTPRQQKVQNGYHLLIVDDSSMNRKMLVKLFTAQGYTCSEAKDGLEAYNTMKSILTTANKSSDMSTVPTVLKDVQTSEQLLTHQSDSPVGGSRISESSNMNTYRTETSTGGSPVHETPRYYYDAILVDNQMPNMDGPTAAKKIRELGYTGIIIGVTGNAMPKDIEEFIQSGANRVLPKPLDMDKVNEIFQGIYFIDHVLKGTYNLLYYNHIHYIEMEAHSTFKLYITSLVYIRV